MDFFIVKPDFTTLSKYYTINFSEEEIASIQNEGYAIEVESYYDNLAKRLKFAGEHVQEVEENFKAILHKYNLQDHYDNLLYLTLSKKTELDAIYFHLYDTYAQQKRLKELAQLMLAFKETEDKHLTSLHIKTLTSSAKVTDKKLISWIGKLINNGIERDNETFRNFGIMHNPPIEELKRLATTNVPKPLKGWNETIANFCFYVRPYLINETTIRPDKSTIVSDDMCKFYYEVLMLLEVMFKPDTDSEPKDYIRTLLKNQIKKIRNSSSGK